MATPNQRKVRLDLAQVERQLRKKAARGGLRQACQIVADQARQNAPKDTGKLAESVRVRSSKPEKGQIGVDVVVGDPHSAPVAYWTEFGTSKQAPNPFFRRAILEELPRVIATVEDAFRSVG